MSKKPDHAKHSAGGAGREALAPDMLLFIRLVAATVIFAVSLIVKMPAFASILLLVLSCSRRRATVYAFRL